MITNDGMTVVAKEAQPAFAAHALAAQSDRRKLAEYLF
jgi:hypothetical protein